MPEKFKCTIISPHGKQLECDAVYASFTAHDGGVGVLANHMPMMCELGLGIMEVYLEHGQVSEVPKKFALIDGGFALVHSNIINIVAADAICCWDMKKERIDHVIEHNKRLLKEIPQENKEKYDRQAKKCALLDKLLTLHCA